MLLGSGEGELCEGVGRGKGRVDGDDDNDDVRGWADDDEEDCVVLYGDDCCCGEGGGLFPCGGVSLDMGWSYGALL